MGADDLLKRIQNNRTLGASQILRLGLRAARALIKELYPLPENQRYIRFRAFTLELASARPSMAPLLRLANDLNFLWDEAENLKALEQALNELKRFLEAQRQRVVESAAELFAGKRRILVHSWSSSVVDTVLRLQPFQVFCTESFPGLEGRRTARKLLEHGIAVTVVTDPAVPEVLSEVELVLVGADAFTTEGFYNKVGTHLLAVAAQAFRVPLWVISESYKGLPRDLAPLYQPEEAPFRIPSALQEATWIRPLFDFTPWHQAKGLVAEGGILGIQGIQQLLESLQVHPILEAYREVLI